MINPSTSYTIPFVTMAAGVPTNATGTPTAVVWRNGSAEATSVTVSTTSNTGIYHAAFTTGSGWAKTDRIWLVISATISSVAYRGIVWDSFSEPDAVMRGTDGANTTTPPTAAANADAVWDEAYNQHTTAGTFGKLMDILRKSNTVIEGTILASPTPTTTTFRISGADYPTGALEHSVLWMSSGTSAEQNSPILTTVNNGDGTLTITLEEALVTAPLAGDVVLIDPTSHVHAIVDIVSGVWSALTSGLSVVGSTGRALARLIGLVQDNGGDEFTVKALNRAPTGGGSGQYAITTVASSTAGVVQGTTFSIVGTAYSQTTRSSGQVVFNLDAGTYTLRTTPPPNYVAVADHSFTVSVNATITRTLVPVAVAPAVIQGAPSASLTLRPAIDRRTPLLTLASVVDHLLLLDEINPGEPRSVERATKAARDALSSFASYSTQGFRYYESRAKIVMPGTVSLGTITVSNGVFTMPGTFTMPSWAPLGHVSIDRNNNKVYPVLLVNGQSITVDTLPNGTYSNVYLEQMFFPLPRNFRRRGTLSDGKNNWPVEDMSGGALQSLQDFYRWVGFSEFDRRFSAVTMDQRQQGDLMLAVWPPFKERVELSMFFERYPEALKHHRVGNSAATLSVTGSTATSTHAIFNDSHIGAAITIGLTSDQELLKSMASESLIDTQRIIRYVSSSTQVILDTPVATPVSSRAFYISDVVDVQSGIMSESYKRLAEYEMLRQTKGSKADKKLQEFVQAFQMTQSDDSRHKPSVDPFSSPVGGNMWGEVKGRP
jgi:hypothetical protein